MVHLKYVTAIEGKTVQLHENYEFAVSADKISMLKSRWLAYKCCIRRENYDSL